MSRQGSLDLIDEVEECLEIMKETQNIKPVKVKSMLEHLRSALEYLANDTYEKYQSDSLSKRPNVYFPYNQKFKIDEFFKKTLRIDPPSSCPMYDVFNSIQDYHTGESWLVMMCNLTNEVKHRQPIPLDEDTKIKSFSVSAGGINLISVNDAPDMDIVFKGNYVNGQKISDFTLQKGKLETTENGIPLNISLTEEKKIKFHGQDYEVIPFIELCIKRLRDFLNYAYDSLEKT